MREGDIVILSIPQDKTGKPRPVLLLKKLPKYNDFLACAISTQLHQYVIGFDIILNKEENYFSETGLLQTSVVRLFSLSVIQADIIPGSIGKLPEQLHDQLLNNLSNFLKP